MTAIVGIEGPDGRVWMGGDSAASCNGVVLVKDAGKVFRRGPVVMGCSGTTRTEGLLRHVFEPPPLTEDVDAYMVRDFVPALRKCLTDAGRMGKGDDGAEKSDGHVLVGVRGRLYEIDAVLAAVRATAGYNAVGSGCEVALGSLSETEEIEELRSDPEARIRRALRRAEQWTDGVRGPFTVEVTEG